MSDYEERKAGCPKCGYHRDKAIEYRRTMNDTLALLGAFRAACLRLCEEWEARDDWHDASSAQELRALLAQTPMDLRGLLQLPIAEPPPSTDETAILNLRVVAKEVAALRVMVGRLSEEVVDLSKRITLAPQEER